MSAPNGGGNGAGGTWLVLGASSAIARAFARVAVEHGCDVLLAGRDRDDLERAAADLRVRGDGIRTEVLAFDAADTGSHAAFVALAAGRARKPLNVFLAFGVMDEQAAIDRDFDLGLRTAGATYMGAVSVLHRLAPVLEAQKAGRVAVLGSVAGDRGRVKNYVYGSAKAGLHAYLQGLRARLFRSGVTVTTIKPGFVDTGMTFGAEGLFLVASPEDAARAAYRHAMKGTEVAYVPRFWWGIMTIIKAVPERVFKRLSI